MDPSDDLTPPPELMFVGDGDFKAVGEGMRRLLVEEGGLRPGDRVLDIGCGVGRIAVPLTRYLAAEGRYDGFDVVGPGVAWCRDHITPRFPNFRFQTVDLYNSHYNPRGRHDPSEFALPYPDASFDFVFLCSVFTHMLPAGVENYLFEISRVLKPGGRCFATFFLWDAETEALVRAGKGFFAFRHGRGVYRVENPWRPEAAVCYDETFVLRLLAKYGLDLSGPVRHGAWSGRER